MGNRPALYCAIAAMTADSEQSVKLSIALSGGPKYHQPIVVSNVLDGPKCRRISGSRGEILIIFSNAHHRLRLTSAIASHRSHTARTGIDRHFTHIPVGPTASTGPREARAHRHTPNRKPTTGTRQTPATITALTPGSE